MKDRIEFTRPIRLPFDEGSELGMAHYSVLNDMGQYIASLQGIDFQGRRLTRDDCLAWLNISFIQDHEEQVQRLVTEEHFTGA